MSYQYSMLAFAFDIAAIVVSLSGTVAAAVFLFYENRVSLKCLSGHISLSLLLYALIQYQWVFGGQLYGSQGSFFEILWALSAIMTIVDLFILVWFLRQKR